MSTIPAAGHSPRSLAYTLLDVFAERPFEGNQLAVFSDATGLSDEQMQTLARETNLSETTFILPGDPHREREEGVRVRIFTTQEELPFAGHPTLGTASWLYWNHPILRGRESITLRLNAGDIPVRFTPEHSGRPGVFATMRQNDPIFGAIHSHAEVAPVLGLSVEDLDPSLPVQTVSTGNSFCIVPIRSLEVIRRLAIPQTLARPWLQAAGARFFFCLAPADPASGADFHNRMQFYNGEDPATGSASGCAIAWLVRHGVVRSGQQVIFEQGIEMGRPSRLFVQASLVDQLADEKQRQSDVQAGAGNGRVPNHSENLPISEVFVSGRTIPVASGRFFLL